MNTFIINGRAVNAYSLQQALSIVKAYESFEQPLKDYQNEL